MRILGLHWLLSAYNSNLTELNINISIFIYSILYKKLHYNLSDPVYVYIANSVKYFKL